VNRMNSEVRNVTHELHSLAESPDVRATRNGETLWSSDEPGVEWRPIENSPTPAASRPARLVQMRDLARRLSATLETATVGDLRLMTQPLFRYPETVLNALDGALFVLVIATDPEIVVWIEATEQEGKPAWRVAFARFSHFPMTVRDGERTVWFCDQVRPPLKTGRYCLAWRAEQMPANPQPVTADP